MITKDLHTKDIVNKKSQVVEVFEGFEVYSFNTNKKESNLEDVILLFI